MQKITRFSMKDCLSVPGLGFKYFNSSRTEEDEPIYTYNDKYMRHFVRQSLKGGRVYALNQFYKSKFCDDVLKILSRELNVERNVYDNIEAYMKYENNPLKTSKEEYEMKIDDYKKTNEEGMEKKIN